jgi:SAM-dependent methyltransferase
MDFFDLVNISERYMLLVNPLTPEKVLTVGKFLRLKAGSRVIDFGCGYGEVLALWAQRFGISGIGIDVRAQACHRARQNVLERGLSDRIQIVCANAADYSIEEHSFDTAVCIGASFIWDGYSPTLRALKRAARSGSRLAIGEPYWRTSDVPPEYAQSQPEVLTEYGILQGARQEGFDFEYVVRASHDDWDRYEADNWHGLVRWLEDNPDHPEREQVISHLHKAQDEYVRYGRRHLGWAVYVLAPVSY